MDAAAVGEGAVGGETLVVFDIPLADEAEFEVVLELGEEVRQRPLKDVGEDVKPAAMRHAENQGAYAGGGAAADHFVEERDEHLPPFEGEALLADEAAVQKLLEGGRLQQLAQDAQPRLRRILRPVADTLHPLLQPVALGRVLDVHEFGADGAAVGLLQSVDNLPQGGALPQETQRMKGALEVGLFQAESGQVEQRMGDRAGGKGIGAGEQVADVAVAVDEGIDRRLLAPRFPAPRLRPPPAPARNR